MINKKYKGAILFKDGEKVLLEVSAHILDKQFFRTWKVRKAMEDRAFPQYSFLTNRRKEFDISKFIVIFMNYQNV